MLDQDNEIVVDALRDVNAVREALGLPTLAAMPDGTEIAPHECPVYHGLRNGHDVLVQGRFVFFNKKESALAAAKAWGTFAEQCLMADADEDSYAYNMSARVSLEAIVDEVQRDDEDGFDYDPGNLDEWFRVRASSAILAFVLSFDDGGLREYDTEEAFLS